MRTAVAIVSSDIALRRQLSKLLVRAGYTVLDPAGFESVDLGLVECDCGPGDPGLDWVQRIRAGNDRARVVILARRGSEDLAIAALRLRADDYLTAPYDLERLASVLDSFAASGSPECPVIAGESEAIRKVKSFVGQVAPTDSSVLITGETGTGKELVAGEIHRLSRRAAGPFVCLNCAAIPESLLESELFGYEKGAFTGAAASRDGKLAQANGGTVFFDEIGDMSLFAQAKVLRAIEMKESYRLGGGRRQVLDIRIMAATNRDLEALIRQDRFRADLYYRLNVARIRIPSLGERPGDIPALIDHFLPHFNRMFGRRVVRFERDAVEQMMRYGWPGNVRELRNIMEITFLGLAGDTVTVRDLPEQLGGGGETDDSGERERMMSALLETHWNVSEAARKLHWSRMTMYRRLAKHNIKSERPRPPRRAAAGL